MTAVTLFNPAQAPAFAAAVPKSDLALALTGGGVGGKRISFKGGVFRLFDGGKEIAQIDERYLDVVLVKAAPKVSRVFYAGAWDADSPTPPDCWSQNGDAPSPDAASPQASRCAECPQNIKGSGQGESRACRYQQRLAVVLASDQEGDVLQVALSALSLFGNAEGDNRPLQEYARFLAANNVNPEMVVTRMRFDTSVEYPKVTFKAMRWLTEDEFANIQAKAQTQDALDAVTMTVAAMDKVAAPMALGGTPPAGKPAPAPAAAQAEEEPPAPRRGRPPGAKSKTAAAPAAAPEPAAPEPTVRTTAAAPVPPPPAASNLADVIEDWDD